jgi:hypothetical protein
MIGIKCWLNIRFNGNFGIILMLENNFNLFSITIRSPLYLSDRFVTYLFRKRDAPIKIYTHIDESQKSLIYRCREGAEIIKAALLTIVDVSLNGNSDKLHLLFCPGLSTQRKQINLGS